MNSEQWISQVKIMGTHAGMDSFSQWMRRNTPNVEKDFFDALHPWPESAMVGGEVIPYVLPKSIWQTAQWGLTGVGPTEWFSTSSSDGDIQISARLTSYGGHGLRVIQHASEVNPSIQFRVIAFSPSRLEAYAFFLVGGKVVKTNYVDVRSACIVGEIATLYTDAIPEIDDCLLASPYQEGLIYHSSGQNQTGHLVGGNLQNRLAPMAQYQTIAGFRIDRGIDTCIPDRGRGLMFFIHPPGEQYRRYALILGASRQKTDNPNTLYRHEVTADTNMSLGRVDGLLIQSIGIVRKTDDTGNAVELVLQDETTARVGSIRLCDKGGVPIDDDDIEVVPHNHPYLRYICYLAGNPIGLSEENS